MGLENTVTVSYSLMGTRELIGELGADPNAVARDAGLSARMFEDPELFVQAGRIVDYFELAAAACNRPDFGLLHARRLPLGMLGHGWMIMRAAETMEEALFDLVRLYGLYTDAAHLLAQRCDEGLWIELSLLPVGRFGVTQAKHLTLGCISLFVRDNLTHRWQPPRVDISTVPTDPVPFVDFFGPGIRFGQDRDAILIDNPTLACRIGESRQRRRVHQAMVSKTAAHGTAVVKQVKSLLNALMQYDECSIETIGDALAVSPRTLQRRLEAAGTTYRKLIDEARADLAWRHVKRSELSLKRIADLLGYHSPAAFSRAFRRWHRMSPRAARRG